LAELQTGGMKIIGKKYTSSVALFLRLPPFFRNRGFVVYASVPALPRSLVPAMFFAPNSVFTLLVFGSAI
jgi:hypothetical protein